MQSSGTQILKSKWQPGLPLIVHVVPADVCLCMVKEPAERTAGMMGAFAVMR